MFKKRKLGNKKRIIEQTEGEKPEKEPNNYFKPAQRSNTGLSDDEEGKINYYY